MKNKKLEIEGLIELNSEQKGFISGGGSDFTDWSWEQIGKGIKHTYNGIRNTLQFFTNGNAPEHIW